MKNILQRLDTILVRILNAILIITQLTIVSLILFLIISRVFGWSVVGVLEIATICGIWLYMAGAVVATRNREHLVVDFLAQKIINPKIKAWHDLIISIFMVVLGVFFISLAQDMVAFAIKRPQTTPALSLPLLIPQSAIVIGAIFTATYALRDFIIAAQVIFAPGKNSDEIGRAHV